jgi:hypothetical protein
MKRFDLETIISYLMIDAMLAFAIWVTWLNVMVIVCCGYILGVFAVFEFRKELKRFWKYSVWVYDGKPNPEPEHDDLSFVQITGMGPFRLPGEKRREQESRKYAELLRDVLGDDE